MKQQIIVVALCTLIGVGAAQWAQAQIDAAPETDALAALEDAGGAEESKAGENEPTETGSDEATESDGDGESIGMLTEKARALKAAGKPLAALGVMLLILAAIFRKLMGRWSWFKTRAGGYTSAGVIAALTIVGLSFEVGFSVDVVLAGLSAAGLSMGLHTTSKDAVKARTG